MHRVLPTVGPDILAVSFHLSVLSMSRQGDPTARCLTTERTLAPQDPALPSGKERGARWDFLGHARDLVYHIHLGLYYDIFLVGPGFCWFSLA